ncbi:MAG: YbaB/EbfC family nucleoid-associated protein [Gaiellaceae bacterium]
MGYGNLAKMAQQMQADMARAQADIAQMSVEGTAGGGAVTAVVNGNGEVVSIAINKDVVDPDDVEMLQDLITAAINDGVHRIKDAAAERMNEVTGGLRIPGLTG